MHPILFELPGGFPIRSFGVMVALGYLLGSFLWPRLEEKYGYDPEHDPARVSQLLLWVLIGVMGGARVMYVVVEVSKHLLAENPSPTSAGAGYLEDPLSVLFIWQGGLVMYGGFLGAAALGTWQAKKLGMKPLAALDTGLVAGFAGQAVGRIGCLLVGDDYGSIVPEGYRDLPFPITVHVPPAEELHPQSLFLGATPPVAGEVLWATQIWMSVNALLLSLVALWVLRRRRYPGHVAQVTILLYAVTRFLIESFRGDSVRGLWAGGLSTSQLFSIPLAAICVWLLWRNRGRRPDDEPGDEPGDAPVAST